MLSMLDPMAVPGGDAAATMFGLTFMLCVLAVAFLVIAGLWKVFTKAGQPGWAAIVPIYNFIIMCRVAGKPGWWVLLCLVPVVNIIVSIIVFNGISKNFGKGVGFTVGLVLLGFIFIPILGFGDAEYSPVE